MTTGSDAIRLKDKRGETFVVRSYAPSDRAALEAMYADFRPKRAAQGLPPEGDLAQRRWLDSVLEHGIHLVVDVDDELVGHAMLIPLDAGTDDGIGTAELANFVHQSVRNRGIGTALNRAALERAREHGYRRVWLSVEPSNRAAIRSYRHAGFRHRPDSLWAPELEMEVDL